MQIVRKNGNSDYNLKTINHKNPFYTTKIM